MRFSKFVVYGYRAKCFTVCEYYLSLSGWSNAPCINLFDSGMEERVNA